MRQRAGCARHRRDYVTALPYGINGSLLLCLFLMLPIYPETKDPVWAWKSGWWPVFSPRD